MALAMVYQAIPEDVLLSIANKKTTRESWEMIKTLCQGASRAKKARVQTLKSEFEMLSMSDSEKIEDFHMRMNCLVTNIRALGETMEESYVVKKLLCSVPARFLQITSTLEQFGDMEKMTIEEAVGSLKAHEERVKGKTETKETQLMLTEEEWAKREGEEKKLLLTREEWLKRNNGDRSKQRGRGKFDKSTIKCYNCNIYGHFASECKKPRKNKGTQEVEANMAVMDDDEPALLLAKHDKDALELLLSEDKLLSTQLPKSGDYGSESNVWYLDNGASNHMTGFRSKFAELDESISGQVRFGDGSKVEIKGKGTVLLACKNGEEKKLREVYYIPCLKYNIISLGQISEEGNKVELKGEFLRVYDNQERLLIKVKRSANRLYKIVIETNKQECLMTKTDELSRLWHARLGHVNYQALALMSKHQMVEGMPKIIKPNTVCDGCLMGKQTRKTFPNKTKFSAKKELELIHGDLCGPISPPTASGYKYFFLLVDDFSRFMWVFFLKGKDEALQAFKNFRVLVENGSERKIKVLRTDRGGEFNSNEFKEFCEGAGIERHFTTPYTPQQNGVVERRNRTIVEMTRSSLKEMQLPAMMWAEAVRNSVYILNRLPARALTGQTLYEAWTKRKPEISHVRIFGCLAHMKTPSVHNTKLDDRSKRVVNLGREPGIKGYRLYDPKENRIHISRDVVFEETKQWPWSTPAEKESMQKIFTVPNIFEADEESQDNSENVEHGDTGSDCNSGYIDDNIQVSTPQSQSSVSRIDRDSYDDSTEPKKFRPLSGIYDATEEVELDEELWLMGVDEPVNYAQAVKDVNWRKAMKQEINSIEANDTWKLTSLPPGQKIIGLKWIYKLKKDANGKVIRYKARLVAKGYVQEHGIDFDEVYAPVTRLETVRLLLALAAKNQWEVHHLDVKTTFLNGDITEDVYVAQPEGFERRGQEHLVYKLSKALYGLRQAPRAWYAKLNACLVSLGFTRCPYEHAVYTRKNGEDSLVIAVYVDDLLVTGTSVSVIEDFKRQMKLKFEMSDMGKLSYYLGIEVEQGEGYIELKQAGYARKILEKAGMADCNPTKYPMDPKEQLSRDETGKLVNATDYKSMVGGLRYLVHTRPDIAYSVGIVSRYMRSP